MVISTPSFSNGPFLKMFFSRTKTESRRFQFPQVERVKSFFEKLRFRDGLVLMVGLTVEVKAAFSNFSV